MPRWASGCEWETDETWTEEAPPTAGQLYDFALDNLKTRSDVFANDFLKKYYKKMFENGGLFFVLDSFDEMPAVLDVSEDSWLIDKLSEVIHQFLAGAHDSRGILASRVFRRPTNKFDAKTVLEIRPFTENKIVDYLKKSLFYDEALVSLLFNHRRELIPVARNPFTAALISKYANDHDNTLPRNQAELYSSYNAKGRLLKYSTVLAALIAPYIWALLFVACYYTTLTLIVMRVVAGLFIIWMLAESVRYWLSRRRDGKFLSKMRQLLAKLEEQWLGLDR